MGIKYSSRREERGESFYNPMLKPVVEELMEKGTAEVSEGAVCVFLEGHSVPLMVQKSDGGFGYASTDMACIKQRLTQEKADWLVYVTDSGSRSGDSVRLVELLDEARDRCAASIRERWAEAGNEISEEELHTTSCIMGYGAVKYADLKNYRMTNYKFSFDAMLDLKGNTSAGQDVEGLAASTSLALAHPRELELALHLCKLPEAIEIMLEEMAPNRLTDYLYELSEKFNQFYTECKVLGSENEAERLILVEATARIMRQVLELLGITPLYRI
ncbi:uncharacterized protein HaLaN_09115 [Haematococcus lacustris]|uniref:arginine--tRNA ligase n=1 Tax=Haematococcus lacustris TaxID=44745 RepID=A0A699Z150_HAELA|nr:uncharacterized protein HaLaN_09115 [Haematococcus lacustris]